MQIRYRRLEAVSLVVDHKREVAEISNI